MSIIIGCHRPRSKHGYQRRHAIENCRDFSGLLVKVGGSGNEIGYVPEETSQGIQILSRNQPNRRFDVDSILFAHR